MEFLIFWIGLSIVVWVLADKRERSGAGWFILSLFISPVLAIVILLAIGDSDGSAKCPACAEKVKAEAKICKHCGSELKGIQSLKGKPKSEKESLFCDLYDKAILAGSEKLTPGMSRTHAKIKKGESVPDVVLDTAIQELA
ncbi:zinc ribbon domain-containing protein [Endozoicomonas sp. GU-1]|uniref:zinc ribbon domain-containing protein n=1 Tax=Endozoicomonas sp. GU-1 TaxID=3009078 RepID=UPI0022B2CEDD|nr:zinc ribbon domain-containing protein [Endozoicomonas sp. GU-1]WBA79549.1 zinc ribbon domain-containing protein [Endozoicomonas sp. GU-1]